MAVTDGGRYGIYTASFVHGGGTLNLQQLDSQDLAAGSSYKTIRPGGAINPHAHILSTANPRARFSTSDILATLTAMGSVFYLACSGGHAMRYQLRLAGGAFDTGSTHFVQTTPKGFLHVTSIDIDIDSNEGARLDLEYVPLSSDGSNPVTNTPLSSLGAVAAPSFISQYFMGGAWLGASQIVGLTRMRILPNVRFGSRRHDGGVWARYNSSSILAIDPMYEFTFLNAALPADIGTIFLNVLGAAIKAYLQRGTTAVDGRIAAATTSHIRVQSDAGSWGPDSISVAGEDDTTTTIRVMTTGLMVPTLGVALGA
jgi:hypothetical protein